MFVLSWFSVLVSVFLGWRVYELGILHASQAAKCLRGQGGAGGEGWSAAG